MNDSRPWIRGGAPAAPAAIAHSFDETDARPSGRSALASFIEGMRSDLYPVIPDPVSAAITARDAIDEKHRLLYAGVPNPTELAGAVFPAVQQGATVDEALAEAVDGLLWHERLAHASMFLRTAAEASGNHIRTAITAALPEILGGLRTQLHDVVTKLRAAYAEAGDLDIHAPDPLDIAHASEAQRQALVTIATETRTYNRIRRAQKAALEASLMKIPGNNALRDRWKWADVFATGVHEVSAPDGYGPPGKNLPPRKAAQATVTRPDVWLPGPDELTEAYVRLEDLKQQGATQPESPRSPAATKTTAGLNRGVVAYLDAHTANNGTMKGPSQ